MSRKIVVVPVYNEEKMVINTLNEISSAVDSMIIINDGSTDSSAKKINEWLSGKSNVYFLSLKINRGKSYALKKGFGKVCELLKEGKIDNDDIIITIDADGQHLGGDINRMCEYLIKGGYDMVITRRDFGEYPFFKIIGNKILSLTASLLGGIKYNDIECGFRFMKAEIVPEIMKYYIGFKYSCEQEIGIIAGRLNYKIDNNYLIRPRFYRSRGTKIPDGIINVFFGMRAFIKVKFKKQKGS
jgi:glycosyltransferase involved in cell wall biosynthesis